MKKLNVLLLTIIASASVALNSCEPFEDTYVKLAMDTELEEQVAGVDNIKITSDFCLSEFDEYNDNIDQIEEIRYVESAYFTLEGPADLSGDNLKLRLFESDGTTLLFEFVLPNFIAANYVTKPLILNLSEEEIAAVNNYLLNYKVDDCFKVEMSVENVKPVNQIFKIKSKVELLAEIKVKL